MGLRVGAAGRRGVDRRDPARGREGGQLDRHRGRLRIRPLRGGRGPGPRRDSRFRAAARLHQVRPALERPGPHGRPRSRRPAGARPRGVRGLPAPARRRGDRPLPVPLARPGGDTGRGLVGRDAAPRGRGQGPLAGRLELRRGAARAVRGGPARHVVAAALLDDPPRRGGRRGSLVRRPRHRRHRLQPDAVGPADRLLHRRARRGLPARTTGAVSRRTTSRRSSSRTWRSATR